MWFAQSSILMTSPMASPLKLLLPPWRFGSNVRSADDEDIDGLSDGAIGAEWFFANPEW